MCVAVCVYVCVCMSCCVCVCVCPQDDDVKLLPGIGCLVATSISGWIPPLVLYPHSHPLWFVKLLGVVPSFIAFGQGRTRQVSRCAGDHRKLHDLAATIETGDQHLPQRLPYWLNCSIRFTGTKPNGDYFDAIYARLLKNKSAFNQKCKFSAKI